MQFDYFDDILAYPYLNKANFSFIFETYICSKQITARHSGGRTAAMVTVVAYILTMQTMTNKSRLKGLLYICYVWYQ